MSTKTDTGPERLYSVTALAEAWEVSPDLIYDLIARGEIAATDLGNGRAKTRIRQSVADAFISGRTDSAKSLRTGPAKRGRAA